jgi:predicted DNA repair protein MutK
MHGLWMCRLSRPRTLSLITRLSSSMPSGTFALAILGILQMLWVVVSIMRRALSTEVRKWQSVGSFSSQIWRSRPLLQLAALLWTHWHQPVCHTGIVLFRWGVCVWQAWWVVAKSSVDRGVPCGSCCSEGVFTCIYRSTVVQAQSVHSISRVNSADS